MNVLPRAEAPAAISSLPAHIRPSLLSGGIASVLRALCVVFCMCVLHICGYVFLFSSRFFGRGL